MMPCFRHGRDKVVNRMDNEYFDWYQNLRLSFGVIVLAFTFLAVSLVLMKLLDWLDERERPRGVKRISEASFDTILWNIAAHVILFFFHKW